MKINVLMLLGLLTMTTQAGFFSDLDAEIREAAVQEFATSENFLEKEAIYASVEITGEGAATSACDMVYQGFAIVKYETVYFDVCVDIEGRRDFDIALSERNIND